MEKMDVVLKINCEVPANLFEKPFVECRVNGTFERLNDVMIERYREILSFLREHGLKYDKILSQRYVLSFFKYYVYKALLNETVKYTLTDADAYNIVENLLHMFTDEKLREYIMGEPMIDAFSQAIKSLPNDTALDATLHGSKILLLRQHFLGKHYY